MEQKFVSEPIKPVVATADPNAMAVGDPGLPHEFTRRSKTLGIAAVFRTRRETGPCTHGSAEASVRKHWFDVETTSHQRAKIYFERQPRGRKRPNGSGCSVSKTGKTRPFEPLQATADSRM